MKHKVEQARGRRQGLAVFGIGLALLVAAAMAVSPIQAQWHEPTPANSFTAYGTVMEKGEVRLPKSAREIKGHEPTYTKVVFKTDGGVVFIIPFRDDDMEAMPGQSTGEQMCVTSSSNGWTIYGGCKSTSQPMAHGILKYHQCEGFEYCFDSWQDLSTKP